MEIKVQKQENRVKVTVFNTGTPIPEADLPNLWNKFYKVDKARTREYGGSGIGLSIVKAIMEGMNQQYGVQNFDNGVEFVGIFFKIIIPKIQYLSAFSRKQTHQFTTYLLLTNEP